MSDTTKILEFVNFCAGLKHLERFKDQVFWRDYHIKEFESVADHSWRMALMLVVLEPKLSQPINLPKALQMVLIHDLPEIICGDPSPLGSDGTGNDSHAHNTEIKEQKLEAEKRAAKEIFNKLPKELGDSLLELWLEYEVGNSFEAQVVAALDKLEGRMQALSYMKEAGSIFSKHKTFSMEYGQELFKVDSALEELAHAVLAEIDLLPERAV